MAQDNVKRWANGDIIALRYISTDARIEMCWPCRVVSDSNDSLAVFISRGSRYAAGAKRSAAEKRQTTRDFLPPDLYEWRKDTLRILLPGQCHSVFLFWKETRGKRSLERYFVNMEEPFRRTPIGVDTQDHTLDINVKPDFEWSWRDEEELAEHVRLGFYTPELASAVRAEGLRAIAAITGGSHPCLQRWNTWLPDSGWGTPDIPAGWDTTPITFWQEREWAYGDDCGAHLC